MIDVGLLGIGGTLPLPDRFLSSVLLRCGGQLVLIDCGEGTQVSLRKLGWGLKDIGTILLTHFHADHVSGIPGLLLTVGNSGRTREEPVTIVGPRGTQRIVDSLRIIAPYLPYPIRYYEMNGNPNNVLNVGPMQLRSCNGDHDTPCLAYRFDLPRAPLFQPERASKLGLPVNYWKNLQRGEPVVYEGRTFQPDEVLGPPRAGLAFGFVTDSRPTKELVEFFTDVDLLICEATYGDPQDRPKAIENKHMTFGEAGMMGAASRSKRLWLTHFSPALPNPDYFRREVEAVYPNAVIGHEHLSTTLAFVD